MAVLPSIIGAKKEWIRSVSTKVGSSATEIYLSSLPSEKQLAEYLGEAYIINMPVQDVGGDGYWIREHNGRLFFAVFDCMGHGHLATIMTRIYVRLIEHIIIKRNIQDPADILIGLHNRLKKQFKNIPNRQIGCGADIAVVVLDKTSRLLRYSGARMDLVQVAGSEIKRTKGHRKSVGRYFNHDRTYQTLEIPIWKKSKFYLFTDGITDLFGGYRDKKLGYHQLSQWLQETGSMDFSKEKAAIEYKISRWVGKNARFDDLLFIGFRLETD